MTVTRPPDRTLARTRTRRTSEKNRSGSRRKRGLGWKGWVTLSISLIVPSLLILGAVAREWAPTSNTSLAHFDAIIVLGAPSTEDGNPSPVQLARVTEAVHEYERGVGPRLILTGAPDPNRPAEARVMARIAEAQGIPESAIFEEVRARNTIENGCLAVRMMQSHGWHSAEVVSSASHLPRAGLIFSQLPLEWRAHAATPLEPESAFRSSEATAMETLKTVRYLVWTRQMDRCEP